MNKLIDMFEITKKISEKLIHKKKHNKSETSFCRERLKVYCNGNGLDIGFGGDPIVPSAITIDRSNFNYSVGGQPLNLCGDAADLFWFRDGVMDYVFSSHLLEDFEKSMTKSVLLEWIRVLKVGGCLVLYLPDEQKFRRHCDSTGQPYNAAHSIPEFNLDYMKGMIKDIPGLEVVHEDPSCEEYSFEIAIKKIRSNPNPIHAWELESSFNDLMREIAEHTLVDKVRCFMIYQYAKQVGEIQGNVAEVGVYKGGTAKLLAKAFEPKGKTIHLFDTFSGMPPTDANKDIHKEGNFSDTSLESVKTYLHDCKNVCFYQGLFPITSKPIEDITFSLVHIDVDIYKLVMDCCKFFYPRLTEGGIMIFDDYGFLSCPGAKMAIDEFFLDKPEIQCYLPTGQCVVTKLSI
jgi:O-methyltransferase